MASVVFSSLGQALGGPFGAMAGAVAGSGVDGLLFGRSDRMAVGQIQRSAYGVAMPRVYGRARVAGLLIWAHVTDRGAKGSGQRAGSASIAVALSSRPIRAVGRIWADGREIRNAAGQFESPTVMRVHDGTGGAPDPVIAAVEGVGRIPGYAGTAYVVFENLSLAAYGNRIPNLSFEVDAGEDDVTDWLADLSGTPVHREAANDPIWSVLGFVASGPRISDDAATVAALAGTVICDGGGEPVFSNRVPKHLIAKDDLCIVQAGSQSAGGYRRGMAHSRQPSGVVVEYLDPQREYQAGMQGAARQRRGRDIQMTLPAVMAAADARAFADASLERAERETDTLSITLGWKWLHIATGDILAVEGAPEEWRVVHRAVQGLQLSLRAVRTATRPAFMAVAEAGRSMSREVVAISATEVRTFEPPFPLTGKGAQILITANGDAGWRGQHLAGRRRGRWRG